MPLRVAAVREDCSAETLLSMYRLYDFLDSVTQLLLFIVAEDDNIPC